MEGRLLTTCCRCLLLMRHSGYSVPVSQALLFKRNYNQSRKSHYDVLKIAKDASAEDIKDAFVKLSKETHPDVNKHDPKTSERFSEIIEAYRILSKPDLKKQYDLEHMLRRHVHEVYPPRSYHPHERNPGDDDYEVIFNRANNDFMRRQHSQQHQRADNTTVIMYLMGVVAFGGLLALGTIQIHYRTRKLDTESYYRKNQATYREEQALRLARGKKHTEIVIQKLRDEAEQRRREYEEEVGVEVTPNPSSS